MSLGKLRDSYITAFYLATAPLLQSGTAASLLVSRNVYAATPAPRDDIQNALEAFLEPLATQKSWDQFVAQHPSEFPVPAAGDHLTAGTLVTVVPKEIAVPNSRNPSEAPTHVTMGLAFRQVMIHADFQRVKKIFSSPTIFKDLYGLDAEAAVLDAPLRARIYKKVPLLSDQDYTLDYDSHAEGETWFTRAKLFDDKMRFAARDNLMVLEPFQDGVLFREVSSAYIRSGFLRMLGPQVRAVTQSELKRISEAARCLAEKDRSSLELKHDDASFCWKQSR